MFVNSVANTVNYLFCYHHSGTRTSPTVSGRIQIGQSAQDSFLEFLTTEESDTGTYVCVVTNSAGERESVFDLNIECRFIVIDNVCFLAKPHLAS